MCLAKKKSLQKFNNHTLFLNSDIKKCLGWVFRNCRWPKCCRRNHSTVTHIQAFFTSRLVNEITPDKLHLSLLSSNLINVNESASYTFGYDSRHMRQGGPSRNQKYTVPLLSPTFMRYMGADRRAESQYCPCKETDFEGVFKSKNTTPIKPTYVFFGWLDSVACDECLVADVNTKHSGVFHDFTTHDEGTQPEVKTLKMTVLKQIDNQDQENQTEE